MFLLGWLLMYSAMPQPRLFALVALVAGAVFFTGYLHLFHIYGFYYVALMLTLGIMVRCYFTGSLKQHESLLALTAIALVLWHPFSTLLFLGFYLGYYLDRLATLPLKSHIKAWIILLSGSLAILAVVVLSPNLGQTWAYNPFAAFVISYRTTEINVIASVVALVLAYLGLLSIDISGRWKFALSVVIAVIAVAFYVLDIPLLLLWIAVVLGKLVYLRSWGLFVPLAVAALLPYAGRIGAPIYALFPVILAVVGTPLGWEAVERRLRVLGQRYAIAFLVGLAAILVAVRVGISVPLVSTLAKPLLAERERTFQLEHALAWLSASKYCAYDLGFVVASGNPIDSVEGAITRRYRPPSALGDVSPYWEAALRCEPSTERAKGTAIITFGGPELTDAVRILDLPGRNAGPATIWLRGPSK